MTSFVIKVDENVDTTKINIIFFIVPGDMKNLCESELTFGICKITSLFHSKTLRSSNISSQYAQLTLHSVTVFGSLRGTSRYFLKFSGNCLLDFLCDS